METLLTRRSESLVFNLLGLPLGIPLKLSKVSIELLSFTLVRHTLLDSHDLDMLFTLRQLFLGDRLLIGKTGEKEILLLLDSASPASFPSCLSLSAALL